MVESISSNPMLVLESNHSEEHLVKPISPLNCQLTYTVYTQHLKRTVGKLLK